MLEHFNLKSLFTHKGKEGSIIEAVVLWIPEDPNSLEITDAWDDTWAIPERKKIATHEMNERLGRRMRAAQRTVFAREFKAESYSREEVLEIIVAVEKGINDLMLSKCQTIANLGFFNPRKLKSNG